MPLIEIEVKFYIENYKKIIKKVTQYCEKSGKNGLEKNILYDTENYCFRKKNKLLRLRSYLGKTILTFKQPLQLHSSEFKKLEETEIIASSFEDLHYILINSGCVKRQIYEKKRQIFSKENLEICVDRLPFGDFLELEGSENDIKDAATALGLEWNKKILPDYRTIFEKIKEEHNLLFNDITFENFRNFEKKIFADKILSFCL
jgi:adenylate cyclase class 2